MGVTPRAKFYHDRFRVSAPQIRDFSVPLSDWLLPSFLGFSAGTSRNWLQPEPGIDTTNYTQNAPKDVISAIAKDVHF